MVIFLNQFLIASQIIKNLQMQPEYNQDDPQRNRHIIFIIITYLLLTVSTHFSAQVQAYNESSLDLLRNQTNVHPQVQAVFFIFSSQNYEGTWATRDKSQTTTFSESSGKFRMQLNRQINDKQLYEFEFRINNGYYIDKGCTTLRLKVNASNWEANRVGKSIVVNPKSNQVIKAHYKLDKVLQTLDEKFIQLQNLLFEFSYDKTEEKPQIKIRIQDSKSQYVKIDMNIAGKQSKLIKSITFAILLFFIAYTQFSAIMEILRNVIQQNEQPSHYSFPTMMVATMWDAVLSIVGFICAFDNEQNLIMFIMPAFILCLLFTNLQLRLMLMIYQSNADVENLREVICKFNFISYGSLILIYPILTLTNFNTLFFIGLSLLFLPQIYTNGIHGVRPQLQSPYYMRFLLVRFLIIFYLKSFPWNVFQLEPNYALTFFCAALISLQVCILWYQKTSGPKKVLPNFLLPPTFNYRYEETTTVEQSVQLSQCSICLNPLHMEPANENDLGYEVEFRLMKTPCLHKYHGLCLLKWMKVKMECPQCRSKLPPFE